MENTGENALRFKAQYFGVDVIGIPTVTSGGMRNTYFKLTAEDLREQRNNPTPLDLKPLSQITDRDLKDILNVSRQEWEVLYEETPEEDLTTQAFDVLRSKGYALPYMGISVEQQIEYNWIKLRSEI